MKPKISDSGLPRLPEQDQFVKGATVHPKSFEISITPRSGKKAEFVKRMWKEEKRELDEHGQFLGNLVRVA